MPSRPTGLIGTLAIAAMLAAAGCTGSPESAAPSGDQGFVSGTGAIEVVPVEDRKSAPDLAGTTLAGDELDVASLRGELVVLNIWASWCAPCRAEAPGLQNVYEDMRDDGVTFVGINTRDSDANARKFEQGFGITYPSLVDPDGELLLRFRETLPPNAVPTTLIVDQDGLMAARALTPLTEQQLRDLVRAVLDGGPASS